MRSAQQGKVNQRDHNEKNNSSYQDRNFDLSLHCQGAIGNCESLALIDSSGSINWLCLPRFDSSSVFARILDHDKGGHFSISLSRYTRSSQFYLADTNILCTDFFDESMNHLRITDFMPIAHKSIGNPPLVRIVEVLRGRSCSVDIECSPRLEYGRLKPDVKFGERSRVSFESDISKLELHCSAPTTWRELNDGATATLNIGSGEQVAFVLTTGTSVDRQENSTLIDWALSLLDTTRNFWLTWISEVPVTDSHHEVVKRSALALKLLTHRSTGGLVAAPTTSLPEEIGGVRNWDYRYVWLRDSTFVVDAFYQLGHPEDGRSFIRWMSEKARIGTEQLQIAYTIDGAREAPEWTLDHLRGYRDSRPVRIGNAAFDQIQLDVYGEVINCIDNCRAHRDSVAIDLWSKAGPLIEWVCEHWHEPDMGIWEMRGQPRHFVYSKVMAWVAVDRAIDGADLMDVDASAVSRWKKVREEIRNEIYSKGWNDELGSFVQAYGSRNLDAANLRLPLVGFISPHDPKMKSTISTIKKHLCENDLVFRYKHTEDGIFGNEATFAICTFWLIQNLVLLGEFTEGERVLNNILNYRSQVGLFSEEIEPHTGELLGNYPQSFTHVGIINSIVLLHRAKRGISINSIGRRHFVPED